MKKNQYTPPRIDLFELMLNDILCNNGDPLPDDEDDAIIDISDQW